MAVATVAVATAVEKPKMNVVPLTSDKAVVSISNENPAMFELSIVAENGDLVYYKESAKPLNSYQRVFDLKQLPEGDYTFNLKVNDTNLSKNVKVESNGIYVGKSKLRFDPYFSYAGDVLKFSYLNFDGETFALNIYNNGELVYESKLGKDFNMMNGYDLSALGAGEYSVVLSSVNREYTYSLVK